MLDASRTLSATSLSQLSCHYKTRVTSLIGPNNFRGKLFKYIPSLKSPTIYIIPPPPHYSLFVSAENTRVTYFPEKKKNNLKVKMMKRRMNVYGRMRESSTASSLTKEEEEIDCEMRPGGMLVQKRSDRIDNLAPNLLLRISYGAVRYEISVNSQATFGELKKLLTVETGLQAGEQRLIFRGKERENGEYLDICGVKDRSKVILMEDPTSKERRFIEMRRNSKIQTAQRAVTDISMDIDKLADQVSAMEKSVSNGTKVPEVQITTLTEMLMRQAIKLENISLEAIDVSAQKNLQGKRVQKCVESLDVLKISNAKVKPVIVSTKWETFDPPTTTPHWEFFD